MTDYTTFTLPNGLRFIHHYQPQATMTAMGVLYDTGSRDESPDRTGLAHLLEHLMFAGSKHIPDFDEEIELAGGTNNAWTSDDFTLYHDIIPTTNIETLFWLESDRMTSLQITSQRLEVQRAVVLEEFKQTALNRPYGDIAHLLRALLYKKHPYAWPTIGLEPSHIEQVTLEEVNRFYHGHYMPSNAIVAISGGISAEQAKQLACKWFAPLPSGPKPQRHNIAEPSITEPRTLTVSRHVPQAAVTIAFPMSGYGTRQHLCADMLTDLLAAGEASRMYRNLTMGHPLITVADASISGLEEPGYVMLNARLTAHTPADIDLAQKLLLDQVRSLFDASSITQQEIDRINNMAQSQYAFENLSPTARVQTMALALMHGEQPGQSQKQRLSVSPDELAQTARELFNPAKSATLIYLPLGH